MAIVFMTTTYVAQGVLGVTHGGGEGGGIERIIWSKNMGGMQLSMPRYKPDPKEELNPLYDILYDRS